MTDGLPAGSQRSGVTTGGQTPTAARSRPRSRWRRVAEIGLAVAVLAAIYAFVLPRIASYTAVWHVVRQLSWPYAGALLLVTLANLATDPLTWTAAMPELSVPRAFVLTQASTAATYIAPAGDAVGIAVTFAILTGWGFSSDAVGLTVALTGVWNVLVELGFPAVALGLLSLQTEHYPLLTTVALIGLAVFVVVVGALVLGFARPELARRVGDGAARLANWTLHLVRRGPVTWSGDSLVHFRDAAGHLVSRRWWQLTLATLVGQLSVFVILLVSLRAVGVPAREVDVVEAFAAWSLVRLLSAFPITPGGLGIVEVGLTGALVAFGGQNARVVAAVLVYRVLSTVPTLVIGLIAGATSRHIGPVPPDEEVTP
jgi:uncharacterized protein (TIRG00374 family)